MMLNPTGARRALRPSYALLVIAGVLLFAQPLLGAAEGAADAHGAGITLLWIAILLLAAKLSGLVERVGQPSVLGELVIGVVLGNLTLIGIGLFEPVTADPILGFLAELGVVILLFQIGLESNLADMGRVGPRALAVAIVGVILPFVLGTWVVGPWLLPGLDFNAYLFLGAALTATSVGITARVFRDLGALQTAEARIVLGAAVIDDVLGLIILAVVSAIVTAGMVTAGAVGIIVAKAIAFLVGAIVLGQALAPRLGRLFSRIHTGMGMKLTLALVFALTFAYVAGLIGLAPIVGAFAAGLVLDAVHFREFEEPEMVSEVRAALGAEDAAGHAAIDPILLRYSHKHVEDLIEPLAHLLVPLFFVLTGMRVNLEALFDLPVLLTALGITVVAIIGKIATGLVAGEVDRWVVGWGMVPRGEVGLIFATIGAQLGVLPDREFAVIVIMVILTTLVAPPMLTLMLRRRESSTPKTPTAGDDRPPSPQPAGVA